MDILDANWRKSTKSGGNGGECVEVSNAPGGAPRVLVRDTKDRERGPVLRFTPAQWKRFATDIK